MSRVLIIILALLLPAGQAWPQKAPAGYVVAFALSGDDRTAIIREGAEKAPKLMMPLYAGDVVFLRDAASRIAIEVGDGQRVEIGGNRLRYEVEGEIATGDDAWSVISAIAGVLGGGEDEQIPENMVSKGDEGELKVPMAVRGPNFLTASRRSLWLAWTGGEGPFKAIVESDGRTRVFDRIKEREFTVDIPASADKRFEVLVKDSGGHLVKTVFRLRPNLPELPAELRAAAKGESTGALVLATWLTTRHEGDWSVEAAQILHARAATDQAAAELLDRLVRGWKLGN